MIKRHNVLGTALKIKRKKSLVAFLDALQVSVQCLESRLKFGSDKGNYQIAESDHVNTGIVIRLRTDEEREAYYVEKIAEMVTTQQELAAVRRERDALRDAMSRMRGQYERANQSGWNMIVMQRAIEDADDIANVTLARLESGELRKP